MPTQREVKKLTKDLLRAIDWAAAEYKYLALLLKEIRQIEDSNDLVVSVQLHKASRILRYVSKAERRVNRFEEKTRKSLSQVSKELEEHLGEEFAIKNVIEGIRSVTKELNIEHAHLAMAADFYDGTLRKKLGKVEAEIKLREKLIEEYGETKAEAVAEEFLQVLKGFESDVSETEQWIIAMEETLRKCRDIIKKIPVRKRRYLAAVRSVKEPLKRKIINIYETPILFRRVSGILAYLELERKRKIIAVSKTFADLTGKRRSEVIDSMGEIIFFETPVPFDSYGSQESNLEPFPNLDEDAFRSLVKETWKLAKRDKPMRTRDWISDASILTTSAIKETHKFIKDTLNNPEKRKIWLTIQGLVLQKKGKLLPGLHAHCRFLSKRGSTFLVDPNVKNLFSAVHGQFHHDYMFEVVAVKDIPEKYILGYLEEPESNSRRLEESADACLMREIKTVIRVIKNHRLYSKKAMAARFTDLFPFIGPDLDSFYRYNFEERLRDGVQLEEHIFEGIRMYLRDKFGIDVYRYSARKLRLRIIKLMGIPIYGLDGQLFKG